MKFARILQSLALACLFAGPAARASPEVPAANAAFMAAGSLHGDARRGKAIFGDSCVACHERHAYGDSFKAVPALAGQRYEYLVKQIAKFAADDRKSTPMHWALDRARLREPQAWVDVAAYLSGLPGMRVAQGSGNRDVRLGGRIFRAQCAACHGNDAGGMAGGDVPSLRAQHYSYLISRLMRLSEDDGHEANKNLAVFLRSFSGRELAAVANYLAHLPGR